MQDMTELCQSYYSRVYRFLLALCGDAHQAEDLTQETFYRALLHIGSYKGTAGMFTWLCTIGKNAWLDTRRKHRRHLPLDTAAQTPDPAPGPARDAEARESAEQLRRAILTLPPDWQEVVILHGYGGVPLKEISLQKGRSESWGKVIWYRARQKLAREMEELR